MHTFRPTDSDQEEELSVELTTELDDIDRQLRDNRVKIAALTRRKNIAIRRGQRQKARAIRHKLVRAFEDQRKLNRRVAELLYPDSHRTKNFDARSCTDEEIAWLLAHPDVQYVIHRPVSAFYKESGNYDVFWGGVNYPLGAGHGHAVFRPDRSLQYLRRPTS